MGGFAGRHRGDSASPIMLGQSVALQSTPSSGVFLPVGTIINRADYPKLSELYPTSFSRQSLDIGLGGAINWSGIAYGNGIYVAVGGGPGQGSGYSYNLATNSVATSVDGINWTFRAGVLPLSKYWSGIAFQNGVFVISQITSPYTVCVSSDGINWTTNDPPMSAGCYGIAAGAGLFALFPSNSSNYCTSPDGVNWTSRASLPPASSCFASTFRYGKFWRFRASPVTAVDVSSDGLIWSTYSINTGVTNPCLGVAYDGHKYIISQLQSAYFSQSTDGVNWSAIPSPEGASYKYGPIYYSNGYWFVSSVSGGYMWISTNGVVWTRYSEPVTYCGLVLPDGSLLSFPLGSSVAHRITMGYNPQMQLAGTAGQYVRVK